MGAPCGGHVMIIAVFGSDISSDVNSRRCVMERK